MSKKMNDFEHSSKQTMRDWWRNKAHSTWKKMSRGASEIARLISSSHKEEWRRKDKSQPHHNPPHHKMHKDK